VGIHTVVTFPLGAVPFVDSLEVVPSSEGSSGGSLGAVPSADSLKVVPSSEDSLVVDSCHKKVAPFEGSLVVGSLAFVLGG